MLTNPRTETNDLCFSCRHACGGCEWSRSFKPVPGWTATPTKLRANRNDTAIFLDSFHITACPKFTPG